MRFDYVALDLDGTMLDDEKKVPADNIKAILQLYTKGVFFGGILYEKNSICIAI